MGLARRNFLHLAAGAVVLPSLGSVALAEAYPARPVRLLVGFPPGGQIDIVARVAAQWLGERLGQPVVIENRPGGGGTLAAGLVANAAPDGYTLFEGTTANAVNASLIGNLSYDFTRDLAPVGAINRINLVLEVNPGFGVNSVAELIAQAKANPGKIDIASPATGTPPYMAVELLKMMAGIDIVHVPFAGEGQMVTDLLGGQIKAAVGGISSSIGHIRAGKLRPLGLTTASRLDELPGVPTIGETVPGFEASGWSGIVAPKHTPPDIIARLYAAIRDVQADPSFGARLADLGVSVLAMPPAAFGKLIADETDKWGKVVRFANLKAE
jgi:tripartite-type tricarboxylate transporter receptor subunit TctC